MTTKINPREIDTQQILNRIGYADDYQPSSRIISLVNDYIENYQDFLAPSHTFKIKDIKAVNGNRVIIEDGIVFKSQVIARLLADCDMVVLFAATIGNYLEDLVAHLAEHGLVLQATVLDAVASGAAEKLVSSIEDKVRFLAGIDGLKASRRFSPGYCDWQVSQQEMVFRALGGDTAGVSLSDTYLMTPKKSVSGIIGLGKGNVDKYNPCNTCNKQDCPGRR